jgi:hypothetical protein
VNVATPDPAPAREAKQENLGKAGNLRFNDGGISVVKKRRTIHKKGA